MKRVFSTLFIVSVFLSNAYSQINIQLLHQLVGESKNEHKVQSTAKDKQTEVTVNEQVNRTKMARLKDRYRQLKSRFHTLGLAIDAAQIGIKASPIVSEIIAQQDIIYQQATKNPLLIPLALDAEKDLVHKSRLLLNYLYGLVVSIGDINQMKASDRKMLFTHVVDELRVIAGTSKGLAVSLQNSNRKTKLNPFSQFINEDKRLVDDIMKKVKVLKQ
ncbi:hypothetical protein WG906_04715 [Pedobacter sp. P351]|uniref:hypothetical protein n=1 Tax=Pedobacter superstes TaxID=3133441 RepID=UPI00309610E2